MEWRTQQTIDDNDNLLVPIAATCLR